MTASQSDIAQQNEAAAAAREGLENDMLDERREGTKKLKVMKSEACALKQIFGEPTSCASKVDAILWKFRTKSVGW